MSAMPMELLEQKGEKNDDEELFGEIVEITSNSICFVERRADKVAKKI